MNYQNEMGIKQAAAMQYDKDYGRNDRLGTVSGSYANQHVGTLTPQALSPVFETMKALEHEITMLAECYGVLIRRLEPVSAQRPCAVEQDKENRSTGSSNMTHAIAEQVDRLKQIRIAMLSQTERLEV